MRPAQGANASQCCGTAQLGAAGHIVSFSELLLASINDIRPVLCSVLSLIEEDLMWPLMFSEGLSGSECMYMTLYTAQPDACTLQAYNKRKLCTL